MQCCGRVRTSCYQIRTTLHPLQRSKRDTFLSQRTFLSNVSRQKVACRAGVEQCFGQRCQKQPSPNTASCFCPITQSGRTASVLLSFARAPSAILRCRHQPLNPVTWNSIRKASSVDLFPNALTPRHHLGTLSQREHISHGQERKGGVAETKVCPSSHYGVHPAAIASIIRLTCSLRLFTSTPYTLTCAPVTASPYSLT